MEAGTAEPSQRAELWAWLILGTAIFALSIAIVLFWAIQERRFLRSRGEPSSAERLPLDAARHE